MRVRFEDGPYDGVQLHLKDGLKVVHLPVDVTVGIPIEDAKVYRCQAEYTWQDSHHLIPVFKFQRMSAP